MFFAFVGSLIAALGAAVVAHRARRGRREGEHAHCARCDHDLTGLPPGSRCPECGADVAARGATAIGRPRPARVTQSIAGVVAVACTLATLWTAQRVEWRVLRVRGVPTSWLIADLAREPATATAAALELERRILAGDIRGGGLVAVTKALWTIKGNARVVVRAGDELPIWFKFGPSLRLDLGVRERPRDDGTPAPRLVWSMRCCELGVNGPIVDPPGGYGVGGLMPGGGAFSRGYHPAVPATQPVGPTRVRCYFEFRLIDPDDKVTTPTDTRGPFTKASTFIEAEPFLAAWDVAVDLQTNVLPAGTETDIVTVADPTLRDAMLASMRPIDFGYIGYNDPQLLGRIALRVQDQREAIGGLEIMTPPEGIAAEVFLRDPASGREWPMGRLACPRGGRVIHQLDVGTQADREMLMALPSPTVELVLRPSLAAARRSLSVSSIWGEELVLKNVTLNRGLQRFPPITATTAPAATRPAGR